MRLWQRHFWVKDIFVLVAILGMMLVGCGGGGSGGSDSIVLNPRLNRPPIADQALDYTLGTPDPFFMDGGAGAGIVGMTTRRYAASRLVLGNEIRSLAIAPSGNQIFDYFDLNLAPREVREEWRRGWTGQGSSVLVVDGFTPADLRLAEMGLVETHGFASIFSVLATGNGASLYALTAPVGGQIYGADGVRAAFNTDNMPVNSVTSFDVVNASFGRSPQTDPALRAAGIAEVQAEAFFRDMKGLGGAGTVLERRALDAVLTKAAGNDGMDAGLLPDNLAFVGDESIGTRVLIVGALTSYYDNDNPAQLAQSSNVAGSNPNIRARFLVDNGFAPFNTIVTIGGVNQDAEIAFTTLFGTSFAAPRVAGYAAIVRHKFPNLTGVNTADIMLETATYEGLVCFPNCAENIYGQGRVDIGAALAPIGDMR